MGEQFRMRSIGFIRSIRTLFLLCGVVSLLQLVGPIFMMQVYDRVLPSGSIPTLIGLGLIILVLYAFFGVSDYIKNQLFVAEGEALGERLYQRAFSATLSGFAHDRTGSGRRRGLEDVKTVRSFLVAPTFAAIFDLFFMPIFLAFIFLIHWILGVTAIVAAVLLTGLAILNERTSRKRIEQDGDLTLRGARWSQQVERQASFLTASGMRTNVIERGFSLEKEARRSAAAVSGGAAKFLTLTKTIRLAIQSLILGIGAALAINGYITPGGIIAASIVFSRTLGPIEQILSGFPLLLRASEARNRIREWNTDDQDEADKMSLPDPEKSLSVKIRTLTPPGYEDAVLKAVDFELKAGEVLGVVGPSGGGKSSLAKALTGAWPVEDGSVRLDNAELKDWNDRDKGRIVGYLPQEIELFEGTLEENIAGFRPDAASEDVVEAAKRAGAHKLFLTFPDGYNTILGPTGIKLSSGQKQRVALARALFGRPFLIVLDEPNSNLDTQGEAALAAAVRRLRDDGHIVVIIAHRPKILQQVDKLCLVEEGFMNLVGPRAAVEARLGQNETPAPEPLQPSNDDDVASEPADDEDAEAATEEIA